MDQQDQIPLFLAEYNSLRAEVLAARGYVAQAAGILAATLMADAAFGFSGNSPSFWLPVAIAAVALIYFLILFVWNESNTRGFTRRLRELEADMNGVAGRTILIWETVHGWGSLFRRINPKYRGFTSGE
jgi:hypothetical protein